ncbi:glycosyltransferase [Empedobacter falsenii]
MDIKKILILSTYDTNGAGDAMYKIAQILISMSFDVKMVVKHQTKHDDFIYQYNEQIPKKRIRQHIKDYILSRCKKTEPNIELKTDHKYLFLSQDESKENINPQEFLAQINFEPEFIFVGITNEFLNTTDIRNIYEVTKAKVFNIAVDMVHFTGGCHYAWDCEGYKNDCKNCQAIQTTELKDIAFKNLQVKIKNANEANFNLLTMSNWTSQQAYQSKIYNHKSLVSLNSIIDTDLLNNKNRHFAKSIFSLEQDSFYIMAGSYFTSDPRKGFIYFIEAMRLLDNQLNEEIKRKIKIIIISKIIIKEMENLPFEPIYIDYIKDYRLLGLLYQATDVFVCTSIEDAGPMMVSEAMACGTPVVAFDTGIAHSMVISGENGYLAELKNVSDLAKGIQSILELSKTEFEKYSHNCVNKIEEKSSYKYVKGILADIIR